MRVLRAQMVHNLSFSSIFAPSKERMVNLKETSIGAYSRYAPIGVLDARSRDDREKDR